MFILKKNFFVFFFILLSSCYCMGSPVETREELRERRQNIYRQFNFASARNPLKDACKEFASDPCKKNLDRIMAGITIFSEIFANYVDAALASARDESLREFEELRWAGFWDEIKVMIYNRLLLVQDTVKRAQNDLEHDFQTTMVISRVLDNFKDELKGLIEQLIGREVMANVRKCLA